MAVVAAVGFLRRAAIAAGMGVGADSIGALTNAELVPLLLVVEL